MKNVFTTGGHDTLSTVLVCVAVALFVIGVLGGVHLFFTGKSRAAGIAASLGIAGAVVAFICSTDAVLVDQDARVDAFVSEAQSTYGLPLTQEDGERAYQAYRSGDDSFKVEVQGTQYLLGLSDKGDDLVLLILGAEPRTS